MVDFNFPDGFEFDPSQQEGNSFSLLPVGEYVAHITEATINPPKTGDGLMLNLMWKIVKGEYEGRVVFQTICFIHSNEMAQQIGRKTLKDICVAIGFNDVVKNTEVFLFKPVCIRIGIQHDKNGAYEDRNKVSRIKPLESKSSADDDPLGPAPASVRNTSSAAQKPAAAAVAHAATAPAGAPWRR